MVPAQARRFNAGSAEQAGGAGGLGRVGLLLRLLVVTVVVLLFVAKSPAGLFFQFLRLYRTTTDLLGML
jgi:hypothetical protein